MGYIPIFVALLGVVVLYSVYNLNLIKPRKAKITAIIKKMAELSTKRKALILKNTEKNENSPLQPAAEALKKTSTDQFQSYKKEEELIDTIKNCLESLDASDEKKELIEINKGQEQLMKQLKSAAKDYNNIISAPPASVLASVFGYRKF